MNRYVRPILFAFEPDVVLVYAKASFGAAGAPTLDTLHSKGLCSLTLNSIGFTATTDGSTAVLTAVSSFAGLYLGMTVAGTGIFAGSTISSMNAGAGTITLSHATTAAGTVPLTASGGQYVLQFGRNAGVNLDTYNRLLALQHSWDESGLQGGASTLASAPAAPSMFLVQNNISVRTIPAVGNSANTDATLILQFGTGVGAAFTAGVPASGEIVRIAISLTRSSAI